MNQSNQSNYTTTSKFIEINDIMININCIVAFYIGNGSEYLDNELAFELSNGRLARVCCDSHEECVALYETYKKELSTINK